MQMNQKGRGQDCFRTPKHIFDQLNNIFNFTVDAACTFEDKLCDMGFCIDQGIDGLGISWANQRVFCNPPFSEKSKWIEKAHHEVHVEGSCPLVVMVLPTLSESTHAFHDYIYPKYWNSVKVLRQRVSFIDPVTLQPATGNNSGTTIVMFMREVRV